MQSSQRGHGASSHIEVSSEKAEDSKGMLCLAGASAVFKTQDPVDDYPGCILYIYKYHIGGCQVVINH